MSYQCNHTYFLLSSLVQQNVFEVDPCCCVCQFSSFILLSGSISSDDSTIICLFIHQSMDIWVVSRFSWLWGESHEHLHTRLCTYLCSFLLEKDCRVSGYMEAYPSGSCQSAVRVAVRSVFVAAACECQAQVLHTFDKVGIVSLPDHPSDDSSGWAFLHAPVGFFYINIVEVSSKSFVLFGRTCLTEFFYIFWTQLLDHLFVSSTFFPWV